ncbi:hypothetical protein niasHT_006164 [Heterodera trifolii]|uniref:Uncharacterized protein n=1 Tax=Heterodera trifolii TaxID=157864 RepID=A0ABD2JX82_9BILA
MFKPLTALTFLLVLSIVWCSQWKRPPVCCDPCSIKYWDCKTKCETEDPENMACEPNCTFALDKCAKAHCNNKLCPRPRGKYWEIDG